MSSPAGRLLLRRWLTGEPSLIVLLVVLWGAGMWFVPLPRHPAGAPQQDREQEDLLRYEGLRPLLGGARSVWMYVDPGPRSDRVARRSRGQDFRAQYALAPVVVRQVLTRQQAVDLARTVADYRLIVFFRSRATLEDLENGLYGVATSQSATVSLDFIDDEVALLRSRRGP